MTTVEKHLRDISRQLTDIAKSLKVLSGRDKDPEEKWVNEEATYLVN